MHTNTHKLLVILLQPFLSFWLLSYCYHLLLYLPLCMAVSEPSLMSCDPCDCTHTVPPLPTPSCLLLFYFFLSLLGWELCTAPVSFVCRPITIAYQYIIIAPPPGHHLHYCRWTMHFCLCIYILINVYLYYSLFLNSPTYLPYFPMWYYCMARRDHFDPF